MPIIRHVVVLDDQEHKEHGVPIGRKHIGAHVLLEPVPDEVEKERVGGEPVIPRHDVVP